MIKPLFLTVLFNDVAALAGNSEVLEFIAQEGCGLEEGDDAILKPFRELVRSREGMVRLTMKEGALVIEERGEMMTGRKKVSGFLPIMTGTGLRELEQVIQRYLEPYLLEGLTTIFEHVHKNSRTKPFNSYEMDIDNLLRLASLRPDFPLDVLGADTDAAPLNSHQLERNVFILMSTSNGTIATAVSLVGMGMGRQMTQVGAKNKRWFGKAYLYDNGPKVAPIARYGDGFRIVIPKTNARAGVEWEEV